VSDYDRLIMLKINLFCEKRFNLECSNNVKMKWSIRDKELRQFGYQVRNP
jgi:hypothetical protein